MKTRKLTLLVLVLMLTAATLAVAQPRGRAVCAPKCDAQPGATKARLFERLDLSEDQQTAIETIRADSREAGMDTRKEIMRLQNELEGLMLQDAPNAGEVTKLVREIGDLKTEQRVRRMETRLAVRAELTDAQRDKLLTMKGDRGPKPGRRGQGRAPRGPRGGRF